jgi:hypothetical protein
MRQSFDVHGNPLQPKPGEEAAVQSDRRSGCFVFIALSTLRCSENTPITLATLREALVVTSHKTHVPILCTYVCYRALIY